MFLLLLSNLYFQVVIQHHSIVDLTATKNCYILTAKVIDVIWLVTKQMLYNIFFGKWTKHYAWNVICLNDK